MRTEQVRCASCGSRLDIPEDSRYIACHVCATSLSVHNDEDGLQTRVIGDSDRPRPPSRADRERVSDQSDRGRAPEPRGADPEVRDLARRLDDLELENALLRLDRDWDEERDQYMVRRRFGGRAVPTAEGARVGLIVSLAIGGVLLLGIVALAVAILLNSTWTTASQTLQGVSCCLVPFVLPMIAVLLLIGLVSYFNLQKARRYEEARARYIQERDHLLGYDNPGPRRDERS